MHLFWDFENKEILKDLDPSKRVELVKELSKRFNIPISYVAGKHNPYIEITIDHDDPKALSSRETSKIPEGIYIKKIAVKHLTYKTEEFVDKLEEMAAQILFE